MKSRLEIRDGYAIYPMDEAERVDEITWNMLSDCPELRSFLPVKLEEREGRVFFYYDLSHVISVQAWMEHSSVWEQQEMLNKLDEMKVLWEMCYIPSQEILADRRFLFVDEERKELQVICIPVLPKEAVETFAETKRSSEKEKGSDEYRQENWMSHVDEREEGGRPVQEIQNREDIWELDAETSLPPIPPQPGVLEFELKPEKQKKQKKRPFWKRKGREAPVQEPALEIEEDAESKTVLLAQDDEGTVLLQRPMKKAVLYRKRIGKSYKIEGNCTKVGKQSGEMDIVLDGNPALSRYHCTIWEVDGEYYLEDHGSSNFTYAAGKRLSPGERERLYHRCEIKLADEEFLFLEE